MKKKIVVCFVLAIVAIFSLIFVLDTDTNSRSNGDSPSNGGTTPTYSSYAPGVKPAVTDVIVTADNDPGYTHGRDHWTMHDVTVTRSSTASIPEGSLLQYLYGENLWETLNEGSSFTIDEDGQHTLNLRYAEYIGDNEDGEAIYDPSEISDPIYINIDSVTEFNVNAVVILNTIQVEFVIDSLAPIRSYTYTVAGDATVYNVPSSMLINVGWNKTVTITATKYTGATAIKTVSIGSDPSLTGNMYVEVAVSTTGTFTNNWLNGNYTFTLSLRGGSIEEGGTFQYNRNDSATWVDISGNTLTVDSTTYLMTGKGDTYHFRYTRLGNSTQQTGEYLVRIDKSSAPAITINKDAYTGGIVNSFLLNITITSIPRCGIRSVNISGNVVLNAAAALAVTDPKMTTYSVLLTPSGNGAYSISVTDNMGRTSAVQTLQLTAASNNSTGGVYLVATGNPTNWTQGPVNLTVEKSSNKGPAITTLYYSQDGANFTPMTGSTLTVTKNGTYYFRGNVKNGSPLFGGPIIVNRIDSTVPTISVANCNNNDWVPNNFVLYLTRNVGPSGVRTLTVRRNSDTPINLNGTSYQVTQSGSYTFTVINGVGLSASTTLNINVDTTTNLDFNVQRTDSVNRELEDNTGKRWIDGTVTFTFNSTPNVVGVPVVYSYSLDNGNSWQPISGSILQLSGNRDDEYTFRAATIGGSATTLATPAAANEFDVSLFSGELEIQVDMEWTQEGGNAKVIFDIYSPNTLAPYTAWYMRKTASDLDFGSPISLAGYTDDGYHYYLVITAEDFRATYRFYLISDLDGNIKSDDVDIEIFKDSEIATIGYDYDFTNTWVSQATISLYNTSEGPSGTLYEYSLNGTNWFAITGDKLNLGVGADPSLLVINQQIQLRARRGYLADLETPTWSNIYTGVIKVDGSVGISVVDNTVATGTVTSPLGSLYTSNPIQLNLNFTNGGSGFNYISILLPNNLSRVITSTHISNVSYTELWAVISQYPQINGTYTVSVTNGVGVNKLYSFTIDRYDATEPVFGITTGGTTGQWTNSAVSFTITNPTTPSSGVRYYYSISTDNGSSWGAPILVPYVASQYSLTFDTIGEHTFKFWAVSGSNKTYDYPIQPVVMIEELIGGGDTVVFTATPSTTSWTNQDITITLSAVGTLQTITYFIKNGINYTQLDANTHTVSQNGTYTFGATIGTSTDKIDFSVTISNIETTSPSFNVASDGDITQNSPVTNNPWNNKNVKFFFTPTTTIASGVQYYLGTTTDNGATWTYGTTAISSPYEATTTGWYRFKAVSGARNEALSLGYYIQIDSVPPAITLSASVAFTTSSGGISINNFVSSTTITVTAHVGVSGYTDNSIQIYDGAYRTINGTWESDGSGGWNFTGTYLINVTGTFTFTVTSAGGGTASKTLDATKVDPVSPSFSVSYSQPLNRWVTSALTFTLADLVTPISTVTYEYRILNTDATNTVFQTWAPLPAPSGNPQKIELVAQQGNYIYEFRATSGSNVVYTTGRNYNSMVDTTTPTITLTSSATATEVGGKLTISGYVQSTTITINAHVGVSSYRADSITVFDGTYRNITGVWTPNVSIGGYDFVGTYTLTATGEYPFTVTSVSGATASKTVDATNIDTVTPTFSISYDQPINRWVTSALTFTLTVLATPASNATYEYRILNPNGTVLSGYDWADTSNLVPSGSPTKIATTVAIQGNYLYEFRATSGTGVQYSTGRNYNSMVDTTAPTITLSSSATAADVSGKLTISNFVLETTITVTAHVGVSGRPATNSITVYDGTIRDVTGTWTSDGSGGYNFSGTYRLTASGEYPFTVTNLGGASVSKTVDATKVDTVVPTFSVSYDQPMGKWVGETLTFTLSDLIIPVSTVTYSYRILNNNENRTVYLGWTSLPAPSGTPATITLEAIQGEFIYEFRAVSGTTKTHILGEDERFLAKVDTKTPILSITDPTNGEADDVVHDFYDLQINNLTTMFGPSGGKINVTYNGITETVIGGTFQVNMNVLYTFVAISNAGLSSTEVTFDVKNIDRAAPEFEVNYSGIINSWTAGATTFTVRQTTFDAQDVKFYVSVNGGARILLRESATVPNTYQFVAYAGNNYYVFSAVARSGKTTTSRSYTVMYDPSSPSIFVDGNPTNYTVEATLVPRVSYGASGGTLTVTMPNGTTQSVTGNLVVYTNGAYVFSVTSGTGITATYTVNVTKIDRSEPVFTVTSVGELNNWTATAVVFTINPVIVPISGVRYYVKYGNVEREITEVAGKYNFTSVIGEHTYTFTAMTNLGVTAQSSAYTVRYDTFVPVLYVSGLTNNSPSNDISVNLQADYGDLSPSGSIWVSVDGGSYIRLTSELYQIDTNGVYMFKAISTTGIETEPQMYSVNTIVSTRPSASGTVNNVDYTITEIAGTWGKDVKIKGTNFTSFTVLMNAAPYTEITLIDEINGTSSFGAAYYIEGSLLFTVNGSYEVVFTDAAGNTSTVRFVVNKPNYLLIGILAGVGAIVLGAIAFLIVIIIRNKRMIARLIAASTVSDDPNKFVMFKKV